MLAVEPDEPGQADGAAAHQPLRSLGEQDHLLVAPRPDRLDEPSAGGKLLRQGRRNPGERRGDEDCVERSTLGKAYGPVAHDDLDIGDTVPGKVIPGRPGDVR